MNRSQPTRRFATVIYIVLALSFFALPSVAQQPPTLSKQLTMQSQIDKYAPLNQAFWPWAHNAFNSSAYNGYDAPNQTESITQHLNAGLRMIDIDPIWDDEHQRVEACHGICGDFDAPVKDRFKEIYDWFYHSNLGAERRVKEVVLLYLEAEPGDMFEGLPWVGDSKFDNLISDLQSSGLANLLYTPVDYSGSTGHCRSFESFTANMTKADILAAGKNVIIVGAIDKGLDDTCVWDNYRDWAFKIDVAKAFDYWNFQGYPDCSHSQETANEFPGHSKFSNTYNDVATFTRPDDMSYEELENLVGCGVNAVSYEEFVTHSWEHERLVWSWHTGEPSEDPNADCAEVYSSVGFNWGVFDSNCGQSKKYACVNLQTSEWQVTEVSGPWSDGPQACYDEFGLDYQFGVPANGYHLNRILDQANTVWINYDDRSPEGEWQPMQQFTSVVFSFDDQRYGLIHGTSRVATLNDGAISTRDRFHTLNKAFEFERGQGARVLGEADLKFEENMTLSLWFRANTNVDYNNFARLVEITENGVSGTNNYIHFRNGKITVGCKQEGTHAEHGRVASGAVYQDGSWHHVAYVLDGSTAKLYIDGDLKAETHDTCSDIQDAKRISIGGYYENSAHGFDGTIDDVRIYGVALTEADVVTLAGSTISGRQNSNVCLQKEDAGWNNGNDLILRNCSENANEYKLWNLESSTGYLRSAENPSKCLHKKNANWNNGNPIHVWDCDAGPEENKTWQYVEPLGYIAAKYHPGKCFHKKSANWNNGNPIHLWDCNAGPADNKTWDFN